MTLADRLTGWWTARRVRRKWHAMGPEEQMLVWAKCVDTNPALRAAFQRCLRVKGYDRLTKGPK